MARWTMDSKDDTTDQAYRALTKFFDEHRDEVVEIVVLPPAIQPPDGILMQEDVSLGVPKKTLALAFVRAREVFFAGLKVDGVASRTALEASRIMLLFDPEHLTAANFRKRRLLNIKKDDEDDAIYIQGVRQELVFLNSILTSPLHRQSKSPTLWYHRTWLVDHLFSIHLAQSSGERFLTSVKAEIDAVFLAGEHHPKNYYAWQYARRLFSKLNALYEDGLVHKWKSSYHEFVQNCALLVKAWCCKHPSDISGWTFLLFILQRLRSIPRRREIVSQVLEFATKLQIKQESLWAFIRTVLADNILEDERFAVVQMLQNHQRERKVGRPVNDEELYDRNMTQAVRWIELHGTSALTPLSPSLILE